MDEKDLKQIESMMTRVVGIFAEDVQHKLDILVEGQQMLGEKVDHLEGRMDGLENSLERVEIKGIVLEKKVDGVAVDLREHRRDTEAHRKE